MRKFTILINIACKAKIIELIICICLHKSFAEASSTSE